MKNICPTCQTEKLFISAWRESYTVVILLRCECKDWPVRVENERFGKVHVPLGKKECTFSTINRS